MFVIGVAVQLLFLRPLKREDRAELSLLVTFAVALLIEGFMSITWKTTYRSINTSYANSSWTVFGYQITLVRFWAFVLSLVALGLLYVLLNKTRFGRAVRATVQNPESARLLGVESERVSALGFGLGRGHRGGGRVGLRPALPVQLGQPLRPDLAAAVDRRAGRPGQRRRCAVIAAVIVSTSSAVVASTVSPALVGDDLLRHPHPGPARPAAGPVRHRRPGAI